MTTSIHSVSSSKSYGRSIWQTAINNHLERLKKGGVTPTLDEAVWSIDSPNDLLRQIQDILPQNAQFLESWIKSLQKLEPVLLKLNDFAAILTLALGRNSQIAAVMWGSIRLILTLAKPVLPEILKMLEELGGVLPKLHQYEQELPMSPALEKALLDTYTEIISFYARTIALFQNNPSIKKSGHPWVTFSSEFSTLIKNLHACSNLVDNEANRIRLSRETKTADTVETIRGLQIDQPTETKFQCYMVPFGLNAKFFGRSNETTVLKRELYLHKDRERMGAIAIHGTGGVGKTQLALHFASTSLGLYEVVLWIPADTQIKITQALSEFAVKIGIAEEKGGKDNYLAIRRVKDWLDESGKKFLLIFDNVERDDLLEQIWPTTNKGSAIITCRSSSVASRRATKVIHLQCLDSKTGLDVFYSLTGLQPSSEADALAAEELLRIFGGLPLAIVQISEFMIDRGFSYDEMLPVFKKSAQRIFAKLEPPPQYEHTLGRVWDVSFERLSTESKTLLNILSFFDPDLISESILSNEKAGISDGNLQFLFDTFDFSKAIIGLKRASLVSRPSSQKALSIHRLVHFTAFTRLTPNEASTFLDHAVKLLFYAFPNTWNGKTRHQGHGWASWEKCSTVLPHVSWLIKLTEEQSLDVKSPEVFAELAFRAGTYLWEREQPQAARSFFEFGLELDISHSTVNFAQACRTLGHGSLDMAQPEFALSAYQKALNARITLDGPNSPSVANVYDSIACGYTEQGDVQHAFEYLSNAVDIHNANNPLHMSRTLAIYAITYLRAGQPEKALGALHQCWELQDLTEEQVAQSTYPKHSGDIVLLSRIKYAQGLKEEAQQLASKTISIRRGILGAKGPRVADSIFLVAKMLEADGESDLAASHLQDIIDISRGIPEMQGHLARSIWFMSKIEDKIGETARAEQLKNEAKNERDKITGREGLSEISDESFMNLVPWMLW